MKELRSSLPLGVAIEKGAFGSPWTTVDQLIYLYILKSLIALEKNVSPVGWGSRIRQQHLCKVRSVRAPSIGQIKLVSRE